MPGIYSGNFADAVIIHPLDTEDGDDVGPAAWTLTLATIEAANARFGNNLRVDVVNGSLDSDVAIAGFNDSDGAKALFHLFWQADSLAGNRTMGGITNSTRSINRTRIFFDVGIGGSIFIDWTRKTDLGGPGTPHIRVRSNGGLLSTGQSFSLVGYIDSGSASQGKVFIDGIDQTLDITNSGILGVAAGTFQHARLGNHINGLDPARNVDEFTIIQDDAFNDTKIASLVAQYSDTRGFGYRPIYISTNITDVNPGNTVVITGSGFGRDVSITVDGITALNIVRLSESSVSFQVPSGINAGLLDLGITNVESGVTFTEFDALNNRVTVWSANGGSTRIVRFGDGIISGVVKVGDPVPFCDPNLQITVWTRISPDPN